MVQPLAVVSAYHKIRHGRVHNMSYTYNIRGSTQQTYLFSTAALVLRRETSITRNIVQGLLSEVVLLKLSVRDSLNNYYLCADSAQQYRKNR